MKKKKDKRVLDIYKKMCPNDQIDEKDDPRTEAIIEEMNTVIFGTGEEAYNAIAWWGHWNEEEEVKNWIKKARKMWNKQVKERN